MRRAALVTVINNNVVKRLATLRLMEELLVEATNYDYTLP